ncbi:succinate--CoA ligase subunit beta [Desulfobacula phenolica]|uniref:Succinyl-CoA synthetase beta subunit n=1 Tax=Desulfobacula phenolica TaxID=90732 RepID=A0A1H2DPV3_9BACT|nr:ATP-grasp domain-containing protein [Desulfobacula phenolica]SDT84927.1 succinyl-CoA synthetase beta subunit [Desulfobacula phenolica]
MRLHEYEGAEIFEKFGIPVPRRGVVRTVEGALKMADEIGYPVVLKSQVLVGGRGLAGGIKVADSSDELEIMTDELLNMEIKGCRVKEIMISEKANIAKELYMAITIDGYSGKPIVVVSTEGGVHIEKTAKESSDKIASVKIDPKFGFYPYQAQKLLRQLNLSSKPLNACSDILVRLYKVFEKYEAIIAEINPLVILKNGGIVAVDAVLEIDDSAMFRLKKSLALPSENRAGNSLENKGKEIGVTYVDLEGDIGLISSGAGLGMASMDIIGNKLKPSNFLETGGGITADLLYKCMELIMMKDLKAIFINIYGGINPIHEGAKGIVKYIKEHNLTIPIVAKALGNHQEETWEILKSGGVHVVTEAATETAVDKLIALLK